MGMTPGFGESGQIADCQLPIERRADAGFPYSSRQLGPLNNCDPCRLKSAGRAKIEGLWVGHRFTQRIRLAIGNRSAFPAQMRVMATPYSWIE
jgi:hypothetical protein